MRLLLCSLVLMTLSCRTSSESETLDFPTEQHEFDSGLSYSTVRMLYATNRRVDETELAKHGKHYINAEKAQSLGKVFSGHRHYPYEGRDDPNTDFNHYGMVQVSIPDHHRRGQPAIVSPEDFAVQDHVGMINLWLYEDGADFKNRAKALAKQATSKDILIMIHGFNVTFASAAENYGSFVYDIDFKGVPILYSWASDGVVSAYADDEDTIRLSQVNFQAFMSHVQFLRTELGGKIHILAHSMGNRLLVDYLYDQRDRHEEGLFENVIFAAPDVDGSEFNSKVVAARNVSRRFTLYANENDLALLSSNLSHNWRRRWLEWLGFSEVGSADRAGSSGDKKVLSAKIDTIDLTLLHTGGLHHSDFATNPVVIQDAASVINASMDVMDRVKRYGALAPQRSEYKADERTAAGLSTVFYQFKVETPIAAAVTATPGLMVQVLRQNPTNKVYIKLFDPQKGFQGDFFLARQSADRYVANWGYDGQIMMVPSLCQIHVFSRSGKFDHVMRAMRDSRGCEEIKKLVRE